LAKTLADRDEQEMMIEQARLLEHAKTIPVDELKRRIAADPPDYPGQRKAGKARGR
jgi:thioredoxin-like negative regulator of GroEL